MRLINVKTFKLEHFQDPVLPVDIPYAILSHTWADDEVTFQDMQDLSIASSKKGFAKIRATCEIAITYGLWYAWVDTCCIDKLSSAELSEAINSMFGWYKNALLCFAFLSDLPVDCQIEVSEDFRKCRWFTRGWTLQELIAPANVMFFDKEWNLKGTKEDLSKEIEDITGIDEWVLNDSTSLSTIPIAKRMSWAANRRTCRIEDMTYCLLGIFEVNIPMIYGEGPRAFVRLQEEIMRKTTDLSLFAWQARDKAEYRGILANSPEEFFNCGKITSSEDQFRFRDEMSMTNKGLKIYTTLHYSGHGIYTMDLHCYREEASGASIRVGIYLQRVLDTYFRHFPQQTAPSEVLKGDSFWPIFIASTADEKIISSLINADKSRRICINFPKDTYRYRVDGIKAVPEAYWHANEQYFSIYGLRHFKCFVRFCVTSRILPQHANHGTASEETTRWLLVCELAGDRDLSISLYAESGLQGSPKPEGFIDPFKDIDQYGPLGDPFSLSVLSPGDHEDHSVSMLHDNHGYDYLISAKVATIQAPPFQITIKLDPKDQHQMDHHSPWGVEPRFNPI